MALCNLPRGAPVQVKKTDPSWATPGVRCKLYVVAWLAVREVERALSGRVRVKAEMAMAKAFNSCGELGTSSAMERVSLRGPRKKAEERYIYAATGVSGNRCSAASVQGIRKVSTATSTGRNWKCAAGLCLRW